MAATSSSRLRAALSVTGKTSSHPLTEAGELQEAFSPPSRVSRLLLAKRIVSTRCPDQVSVFVLALWSGALVLQLPEAHKITAENNKKKKKKKIQTQPRTSGSSVRLSPKSKPKVVKPSSEILVKVNRLCSRSV